jgi:hypothetical protein
MLIIDVLLGSGFSMLWSKNSINGLFEKIPVRIFNCCQYYYSGINSKTTCDK